MPWVTTRPPSTGTWRARHSPRPPACRPWSALPRSTRTRWPPPCGPPPRSAEAVTFSRRRPLTGADAAGSLGTSARVGTRQGIPMLHYAVVFFIIAIVAGVLGFGGIAAGAAGIARILFFIFLILALITFLRRPRS